MENRQIDNKSTKQIRIDSELHRLLKIKTSSLSTSIKTHLEGLIIEDLEDETAGKDIKS